MTKKAKLREWNIPLVSLIVNDDAPRGFNKIRVIEYLAYDELQKENAKLKRLNERLAMNYKELKEIRARYREALAVIKAHAKCDGGCAPDECICHTKKAKEFLKSNMIELGV